MIRKAGDMSLGRNIDQSGLNAVLLYRLGGGVQEITLDEWRMVNEAFEPHDTIGEEDGEQVIRATLQPRKQA